MSLAQKILDLIARERSEGESINEALKALQSALDAAKSEIVKLLEQVTNLSSEGVEVSGLKKRIKSLEDELSKANNATNLIAAINYPPEINPHAIETI